jgi:hypothetical protein
MTMSIEALTFVLGAVLLLTGILGGGFQIKDLRIPKVDRVPRVAATVCGLGFIGVGLMCWNIQLYDPRRGTLRRPGR